MNNVKQIATMGTANENGRNYGGEKETVNELKLIAMHSGKLCEIVDARFYMGRSRNSSRVYCSVWICTPGSDYLSGTGWAGGGGYHKESAALQDALESAGVKLSSPIDGRGESAMHEALEAIGRALKCNMREGRYLIT